MAAVVTAMGWPSAKRIQSSYQLGTRLCGVQARILMNVHPVSLGL